MQTIVKVCMVFFLAIIGMYAQEENDKKALYIPAKVWRVPENNNYDSAESAYSYSRMVESDNIAMFWHKEYGEHPMANPDTTRRFDPETALIACERFYNFYVNDLKLVEKGHSISDTYKLLIYVFGGDENTAFGGGEEDKVGILWTPATRINKAPYGALAHEIGHSFQYMSRVDSKTEPRGPVMEMSAQYMLWQVYPEWMTFENYHLKDFLKGTHYAFLHPANMYHAPYVLEYWSHKYGIEFWGKLSRSTQEGEDVVTTYKRINNLTQEQFNDDMFDASRKFITWDLKRIEEVAKPYANQHISQFNDMGDGWYQIDASNCPQNYGYNGIKLHVTKAGTNIQLRFKSILDAKGYNVVRADSAGWRYGFLASLKDSTRIYGDVHKDPEGVVEFEVPENTAYLWLVVMGAPKEHRVLLARWGEHKSDEPDAQWPYKIKLVGTALEASVVK
jgi:hypothetical protein